MRKLFFTLTVLIPVCASAGLSIEARSDFERWSAGFGETSNNILAGVGAQYVKGRYFGGAGLGSSITNYALHNTPDSSLARREIDAIGGYIINQNITAYGGYRLYRVEYDTRDATRAFTDNIQGLGGGATYSLGFAPNLAGFLSVTLSGVYSAIGYSNTTDQGIGMSYGSEFGLGYRFSPSLFATASFKFQTMNIDYGESKWTNSYSRLGARLSYRF